MAQCPVCQSDIPDDFGLIDCPRCKTPLFVQMDGSVQSMADAGGSDVIEHGAGLIEDASVESPDSDLSDMLVDEVTGSSFEESPMEAVPMEESPMEEMPSDEMAQETSDPSAEEPSADDIDAFFDDTPAPNPIAAVPVEDLSQLANSTDNDSHAGAIRYNIAVVGIDTAEIRKEFRDLISDRRFLFDVDGILKSIRSGRVKMQNVTAVKAILLIQRLRGLPVNVQWEQHIVHQD